MKKTKPVPFTGIAIPFWRDIQSEYVRGDPVSDIAKRHGYASPESLKTLISHRRANHPEEYWPFRVEPVVMRTGINPLLGRIIAGLERGYSVTQIANRAKIPPSTVYAWLKHGLPERFPRQKIDRLLETVKGLK